MYKSVFLTDLMCNTFNFVRLVYRIEVKILTLKDLIIIGNDFLSSLMCKVLSGLCLQCFDAVGWATGRASGL